MKQQFSSYHGAVSHISKPGQQVLAKDYQNGTEKWTKCYIWHQTGNVTYDVSMQSCIWVQHANQIHFSNLAISTNQRLDLPLNILLDTFDLPWENAAMSSRSVEHRHRPRPQGMKTRSSVRAQHSTKQLQVNP